MPNVTVTYNDIGGFAPYLSGMQSGSPRVLRGRNYRWNFSSVYSGWGGVSVSRGFTGDPAHCYHLASIDDVSYLCTLQGIFIFMNEEWVCLLELSPNEDLKCKYITYPWTEAQVGDSHYICHPLVGVIKHCHLTRKFSLVDTSVVSSLTVAICEAGCRLIYLGTDVVSWSAIDAGHILTDNALESGFMSLSIASYGTPLGVYTYNGGFVLMTSSSIVRAVEIDSVAAFNMKVVTKTKTPISASAITYGEDSEIIFLDKKGLHKIQPSNGTIGLAVNPFEIPMSKWIMGTLVGREQWLLVDNSTSLFYSASTQELFVSLPAPRGKYQATNLKTRALVFNEAYGKWCSFDQLHFCLGPVNQLHSKRSSITLGYMGRDSNLVWFNNSDKNDEGPLDSFVVIGPMHVMAEGRSLTETTMTKVSLDISNATEAFWGIEEVGLAGEEDNWQDTVQVMSRFCLTAGSSNDLNHANYNPTRTQRLSTDDKHDSFTQTYTCSTRGLYHTIKVNATVDGFYEVHALAATVRVTDTDA